MIMVAIAVDRYLSICQPLLNALTPRRAWLVAAVLAVFAAAIGLMVAFMYSVRHYVPLDRKQFSNESTASKTVARYEGYTLADYDVTDCPMTSSDPTMVEVDRGVCYPTDHIFSPDFLWYFQKVYNALFLVCFISVVVLYVLIYRSVLTRRSRRQRQKNRSVSLIASYTARQPRAASRPITTQSFTGVSVTGHCEEQNAVELHALTAGGCHETDPTDASTSAAEAVVIQAIRDRKKNRVANLKTAAMLFVVTVVFVVTFLPAFLMTVHFLPYNRIIFYMYFANNVANPIIYSFMNHNFRGQLKRMLCRRHDRLTN